MKDNNKTNIEMYDGEEIYCRKLGHHLSFKYCRMEREGFPCSKIIDCWFTRVPIGEYIQKNFNAAEIAGITATPRPKVATLLELIGQAKERKKR